MLLSVCSPVLHVHRALASVMCACAVVVMLWAYREVMRMKLNFVLSEFCMPKMEVWSSVWFTVPLCYRNNAAIQHK
jgi:hypothetical protein